MRTAAMAAAIFLALVVGASSAQAQDGLRSASLPERPIATPPPGPNDLFRATPQTYGPNPSPQPSPYFFPGGIVYGGWPWPYGPERDRKDRLEERVSRLEDRADRDERQRAIPPPLPPAPAAAPAPPVHAAAPKTFYVIPGCYAGDRPPSRTTLARCCDRSKLRVISATGARLPATGTERAAPTRSR